MAQRGRKTKNVESIDFPAILARHGGNVAAATEELAQHLVNSQLVEAATDNPKFKRVRALLDAQSEARSQRMLIAQAAKNADDELNKLNSLISEFERLVDSAEDIEAGYEAREAAIEEVLSEFRNALTEGRDPNPARAEIAQGDPLPKVTKVQGTLLVRWPSETAGSEESGEAN